MPCCFAMVLCPQCSQARSRDCIEQIRHVTASIVWEPCHRYAVHCQGYPTSVGEHRSCHMKFLQSSSNIWRMTCFWWQLTHDITVHIMRLSLEKGCFEINVEKTPTFAGATHPKSRSSRSRRICLQVLLLFVLESSQYPSRLCPEEVALLVGFNG